jgi:hypothetical protein
MRRSASETLRNLETRIARLEGKTASSMSVRAFNADGDAVSPYKDVKCELTPRGIASCIKREFGCDADTRNIKLWVGYGNDATEIKVPCTHISGEIAYVCIYLVYGAEYSIF